MGISLVHWLVVLLPVVAGTIAVWLLLRRQPRPRDLMAPPVAPARIVTRPAATAVELPADVATRVWAELRFGRDISAIKLVRGATGLDLRDSKALVDDMKRRDPELR